MIKRNHSENFKDSKQPYQQYINQFPQLVENIYDRQLYRIYLKNQAWQSLQKDLKKSQNQLIVQIQQQKTQNLGTNKDLNNEVQKLKTLKNQYQEICLKKLRQIEKNKEEIANKKKQVKRLKKLVKDTWKTTSQTFNNSLSESIVSKQNSSLQNHTQVFPTAIHESYRQSSGLPSIYSYLQTQKQKQDSESTIKIMNKKKAKLKTDLQSQMPKINLLKLLIIYLKKSNCEIVGSCKEKFLGYLKEQVDIKMDLVKQLQSVLGITQNDSSLVDT